MLRRKKCGRRIIKNCLYCMDARKKSRSQPERQVIIMDGEKNTAQEAQESPAQPETQESAGAAEGTNSAA